MGAVLINIGGKSNALTKDKFSRDCKSDTGCKKELACEKMVCINDVMHNFLILDGIRQDCDIDSSLYDPPNAFGDCKCIDNLCQFEK